MRRVLLIALGGAAGTVARAAIAETVPAFGVLPVATLLVNVLGALVLGVLVAGTDDERIRALWGVGVLGAFTTFSTFAWQITAMPVPAACGYVALTLAGGLAAAWWGLRLGRAR